MIIFFYSSNSTENHEIYGTCETHGLAQKFAIKRAKLQTPVKATVKALTLTLMLALLVLSLGLGGIFACPATGLAQSVQNEVKGTILPPGSSGSSGANDNSEATTPNTTEQVEQTGQPEQAGQAERAEQDHPAEVAGGNGTAISSVNATQVGSANATASGSAGSGSLGTMANDDYFKALPKEETSFSWSGYFMAIGGLLLVLAMLWVLVWVLRKRGAFPGAALMSRNAFKLEATLPLGPKRAVMLVRFLNSRYLLGVTDQQITLIKELEEQDAQGNHSSKSGSASGQTVNNSVDSTASSPAGGTRGAINFADALQQESQKPDGKLKL